MSVSAPATLGSWPLMQHGQQQWQGELPPPILCTSAQNLKAIQRAQTTAKTVPIRERWERCFIEVSPKKTNVFCELQRFQLCVPTSDVKCTPLRCGTLRKGFQALGIPPNEFATMRLLGSIDTCGTILDSISKFNWSKSLQPWHHGPGHHIWLQLPFESVAQKFQGYAPLPGGLQQTSMTSMTSMTVASVGSKAPHFIATWPSRNFADWRWEQWPTGSSTLGDNPRHMIKLEGNRL